MASLALSLPLFAPPSTRTPPTKPGGALYGLAFTGRARASERVREGPRERGRERERERERETTKERAAGTHASRCCGSAGQARTQGRRRHRTPPRAAYAAPSARCRPSMGVRARRATLSCLPPLSRDRRGTRYQAMHRSRQLLLNVAPPRVHSACMRLPEREFCIDNLLVRVHRCFWCTSLAPWEFEFPFSGSIISTFL